MLSIKIKKVILFVSGNIDITIDEANFCSQKAAAFCLASLCARVFALFFRHGWANTSQSSMVASIKVALILPVPRPPLWLFLGANNLLASRYFAPFSGWLSARLFCINNARSVNLFFVDLVQFLWFNLYKLMIVCKFKLSNTESRVRNQIVVVKCCAHFILSKFLE